MVQPAQCKFTIIIIILFLCIIQKTTFKLVLQLLIIFTKLWLFCLSSHKHFSNVVYRCAAVLEEGLIRIVLPFKRFAYKAPFFKHPTVHYWLHHLKGPLDIICAMNSQMDLSVLWRNIRPDPMSSIWFLMTQWLLLKLALFGILEMFCNNLQSPVCWPLGIMKIDCTEEQTKRWILTRFRSGEVTVGLNIQFMLMLMI